MPPITITIGLTVTDPASQQDLLTVLQALGLNLAGTAQAPVTAAAPSPPPPAASEPEPEPVVPAAAAMPALPTPTGPVMPEQIAAAKQTPPAAPSATGRRGRPAESPEVKAAKAAAKAAGIPYKDFVALQSQAEAAAETADRKSADQFLQHQIDHGTPEQAERARAALRLPPQAAQAETVAPPAHSILRDQPGPGEVTSNGVAFSPQQALTTAGTVIGAADLLLTEAQELYDKLNLKHPTIPYSILRGVLGPSQPVFKVEHLPREHLPTLLERLHAASVAAG